MIIFFKLISLIDLKFIIIRHCRRLSLIRHEPKDKIIPEEKQQRQRITINIKKIRFNECVFTNQKMKKKKLIYNNKQQIIEHSVQQPATVDHDDEKEQIQIFIQFIILIHLQKLLNEPHDSQYFHS